MNKPSTPQATAAQQGGAQQGGGLKDGLVKGGEGWWRVVGKQVKGDLNIAAMCIGVQRYAAN